MVDPKLYEEISVLVEQNKDLNTIYSLLTPKGYPSDQIAEAFKIASKKKGEVNPVSVNTKLSQNDNYDKVLVPLVKSVDHTNTIIITTNDIPLGKIIVLIIVITLAFLIVLVFGMNIYNGNGFDLSKFFQDVSQKAVSQTSQNSIDSVSVQRSKGPIVDSLTFFFQSVSQSIKNLLSK